MATFLYRIGRWTFRRRRLVGSLWLAALVLVGVAAATAEPGPEAEFSMPGTEAQEAFDLLNERFPGGDAQGAEARLVFQAPDGQRVTAGPHRAAVEEALGALAGGDQVASATDPFATGAVSEDGAVAYATLTYTERASGLTEATTAALEDAAGLARDAGLTVEIGGSALEAEEELGGVTELIGLAVAALVLVITFGSLIAAGLPLLTALIGVAVGFCLIAALADPLGLSSTTSILAIMLGTAVGIDYALFIVSRYRSERAGGRDPEEAAGRAVGTAGTAVVFAGLTVIIALSGLAVVGIPILTKMGLAAAGTVALAVLVALTLVPPLLGFAGRRLLPRAQRKANATGTGTGTGTDNGTGRSGLGRSGLGVRWARFVLRRPAAVLLTVVAGLGIVATPALSLELSLPGDESLSTDTTQRRAYDLLSAGFGPGFNGPLTVVVDTGEAADPQGAADLVADTVTGVDGVVSVGAPVFNEAGDTAVLTAVPGTAPNTTETADLVHTIRDAVGGAAADTGAEVLVTGTTALNIDVSQALGDALIPYLAIVVGLAVLLLAVVFRSVLIPLKATLGFLLSVGAALGTVVAVVQWGWAADAFGVGQTGPVMSLMPILLIGVVFGLAMDYEVFLLSRMREAHVHGANPREAITDGFRHSGRVVAAAAFIMISVFAGFVGMTDPIIKTLGIGLAAAIAFDAFVVRMAMGPAVMALLGRRAWWLPRSLDRMLPNVDVEGEALGRAHPAPANGPTAEEPRPVSPSRAGGS
ncbi:MMPL family transporter [Streptomyces johnsoniae]|uniref:MMPL family transporter n=1 Tax=Streptomyces johnsoniae TaxID=3075532 RepID=A0ABU2S484_9ACTN|nr:MMPL family transporter [Streptomyces sp. DSM 41886]MDT0443798.1 MMPL family transporter [Streptomyces sp. DSM 41886]